MRARLNQEQEHARMRNQNAHLARMYSTLYHGTSLSALPDMLRNGIRPRGQHGRTNWEHSVESNPTTVYLTDAYAHYFAFSATEPGEGSAVLEIDVDVLVCASAGFFVPDEDALEQSTRGRHVEHTPKWLVTSTDMERRTRWYRDHAHWFDPVVSLQALGTVGWRGIVPGACVRRVCVLTHDVTMCLALAFDPTISLLNYKLMGERYRMLMRALFDGDSDEQPRDGFTSLPHRVLDVCDAPPQVLTRAQALAQFSTVDAAA